MSKMREQLLLWFLCASLVFGCQEPYIATTKDNEQKLIIKEEPLTLSIINKHLSEATLVIFTDIAANISIVVYRGEVWAVSKAFTGTPDFPTLPGVYTVHLIDYCPPWPSGPNDKAKKACSTTNRLGMIAFWFKLLYGYGVHTRHLDASNLEFSRFPSASDRKGTKGCIAAPHQLLEKILFDLIFKDPAFVVYNKEGKIVYAHPVVKTMTEYNKKKIKKTAAVRLKDFNGDTIIPVEWEKGDPVSFDMRVVNIDTSDRYWIELKNQNSFKENQALFRFFDPEFFDSENEKKVFYRYATDHPEIIYKAVTNCTAEKDIPLFKSNESFHPDGMMSTIERGSQLKKVHLWPVNEANTSVELELGDAHVSGAKSGWIQNLDSLQCSKDIYWSSEKPSLELKK